MLVCALFCGCATSSQASFWAHAHGAGALSRALKFLKPYEAHTGTIYFLFRVVDVDTFTRELGAWLNATPPKEVYAALVDGLGLQISSPEHVSENLLTKPVELVRRYLTRHADALRGTTATHLSAFLQQVGDVRGCRDSIRPLPGGARRVYGGPR